MADENTSKVFFKKPKSRNQRRRLSNDDSGDENVDEPTGSKLSEMKFVQKLRARPHGVNIAGLGSKSNTTTSEQNSDTDPFKIKSGGMINLKNVTVTTVDDAYDVGIGTQFSAETNKRDEDEEMMKYIEQELSRKKQAEKGGSESIKSEHGTYFSPEDAALASLPDHLSSKTTQRSEEMLSNQMLSGIPEIDLGIESKIKNIEATEDAKLRLVLSQGNRSDGPSQFVPTNITVNFAQPNKINVDEFSKKEKKKVEKRPVEGTQGTQRATDDFLYEKFKKQFRRY